MFLRPSWDSYFLEIASVVANRSTCLRRKVGAVLVRDKRLLTTGYNGAPSFLKHCLQTGCLRQKQNIPSGQRHELCRGLHAEQNAIINGNPEKMKGSTIYIAGKNADGSHASGKPCLICRRMIINAMVKRIVCLDEDGYIKVEEL